MSYEVRKMSTDTTRSNCEVHSVIKFLSAEGVNWCEIHRQLCVVFSEGNVTLLRSIYQWITISKAGKTSMHDEQHKGHPSISVNDKTVNILHTLLEADGHLTRDDLFHKLLTEYGYITLQS